jgi:hypothetical protein
MTLDDIRGLIKGMISLEKITDPSWVTDEIISRYPLPDSMDQENRDFTTIARHKFTRDLVAAVIRGLHVTEEFGLFDLIDPDWRKEGYEELQNVYSVRRGKKQLLIPLHLMSDEEIDDKISEMARQIRGLNKHMDELQRYKESRHVPVVA